MAWQVYYIPKLQFCFRLNCEQPEAGYNPFRGCSSGDNGNESYVIAHWLAQTKQNESN